MLRSDRLPGVTGEWECMECGYIEEGVEARRPKRCPECEAPADALEFFPYDEGETDWDHGETEEFAEEEEYGSGDGDDEEDEFEDEEP